MSDPTNEAAAPAAPAAPAADAAPPATPSAGDAGATPPAGAGAYAEAGAAPAGAAKPFGERIPEKYRVTKEDGSIDIEASTAKLLDGHEALQKRFGAGADKIPPKSPEEYAPKVEGFDFEAMKTDDQYKGFLKGAHARGFTNDDLSWLLGEYATRAGGEAPPGAMSPTDFKADMLANHWKSEDAYKEGMGLGLRAIRAQMPDITAEEIATLPAHPIIARVLAAFGKEVGEDEQVRTPSLSAADFDSQLAALQADPAYGDAMHPQHSQVIQRMKGLYDQRYNT